MRFNSLLKPALLAAASLMVSVQADASTTLKSDQDKISYMVGYQIGSNFKRDGLDVDVTMLLNGMKEAMAGTKPSPIPKIEWGPGGPPDITADSAGSTAAMWVEPETSRSASPTPINVPPVPTPATKALISTPADCSMSSRPVVVR